MRYFLAVASHGSFAAAARASFVSQPSLSLQVARMENELGCRLFDRHPNGVRLTPQGEHFRALCERILRRLDEGITDLREGQPAALQQIRIAVPPILAGSVLSAWLRPFVENRPSLRLRVIERENALLPESVVKGEADIAVMSEQAREIAGTKAKRVGGFGYRVYAARTDGLAKRKSWKLDHLCRERLILFRDSNDIEARIAEHARKLGVTPEIACSSSLAITVLEMCTTGMGVGVAPDFLKDRARILGLNSAPLSEPGLGGAITVLWRPEKITSVGREFLESIRL